MFELTDRSIDPQQLARLLSHPAAGACATFEGRVRDTNEERRVRQLAYEAYPEVAVAEGQRILEEAREQFGLTAAAAVHRVGTLSLGELAVWVGVSAPHRGEAFEACRYIIDEVKARVPIWKKETYVEGESQWINAPSAAQEVGSDSTE